MAKKNGRPDEAEGDFERGKTRSAEKADYGQEILNQGPPDRSAYVANHARGEALLGHEMKVTDLVGRDGKVNSPNDTPAAKRGGVAGSFGGVRDKQNRPEK
jgi:hypothetical protein